MSAWLLHQGVLTQLTSGSKMINPLKLFTDVTSGDLNKGDVLLLTTPALTDYISEVKIKQIVSHGSPAEMVEKFDVLLQAVPTFVSFAAIIVKAMESAQETDLPEREKTH
jgi:serine/threonine protein phosphatase PrpC